jgi:nucleoid-associated protein YgaU
MTPGPENPLGNPLGSPLGASSGSPAPKADFSDVQSGSSTTAPATPAAGAAAGTYTVKSGDSLSKIAKHHYGDASKWHAIYDANRDQLDNPDLIHPGQVLKLPAQP